MSDLSIPKDIQWLSQAQIKPVIQSAAESFSVWSDLPFGQRRDVLLTYASLILEHSEQLIETMQQEIGMDRTWAKFNCTLGSEMLKEAACMCSQIGGQTFPSSRSGILSFSIRQPAGVVLSIAPWNAPLILGLRSVALALACGNSAILKASEVCPITFTLLGQIALEAGMPKGVLQVIHTSAEDSAAVVEQIISDSVVRRINFTGSTRVGRFVAEVAAKHLKKCLLELGSKTALVVLDDADIQKAADAVAFGGYLNQGQLCLSTERIIVHASIAEDFTRALAARVNTLTNLQVEEPTPPNLVNENATSRVEALVKDALEKGARLVQGTLGTRGSKIPPIVLDRINSSMRVYDEECFGPVVYILLADDIEEAIDLANDTEYGLVASVFSRDVSRALMVAQRLETGICHINTPTVYDEAHVPFGGMKSSGFGRFGGQSGIDEFTELRWITFPVEGLGQDSIWKDVQVDLGESERDE